jgi:hypothetical protein
MANFRSPRIPRIVVTDWPRVYDNLTLDGERHYNEQPSGGGTIPPYTGRYYVNSHTGEPALVVYLYDVPELLPSSAEEPETVGAASS